MQPPHPAVAPMVEELTTLVLEQMKEYAIALLDPDGIVLWLNAAAEELFGHTRAMASGKTAHFLFVPEDASRGVFEHEMETAAAQGSMENDRWMLRADGSRFWANGVMFPLRDGKGDLAGFAKVLRDRTDLRQQLITLRNEVAALSERGKHKDKVLAVAAHELRNPLFATAVAVDTIRRTAQDAPGVMQSLAVIDRQLHSIRRLLDDITDATQAHVGKMNLKRERLDLREITSRALETMRPAIVTRRHTVNELGLPVEIPVIGDPARLQQVIQNLIDNAIKYTSPGGRIGIELTVEGSEAVFKIEDNGVGVPADMQAGIFDLFTQIPDPQNLDEKGLGIGLSLVKNLVLQHGGSVQVRSNGVGKGSEFTVRLPLASG